MTNRNDVPNKTSFTWTAFIELSSAMMLIFLLILCYASVQSETLLLSSIQTPFCLKAVTRLAERWDPLR